MNDTNYIAVVIGRNRRIYARSYKRDSVYIERMSEHYKRKEAEKSAEEGFRVTGMTDESPNEHVRIFRVQYAPMR